MSLTFCISLLSSSPYFSVSVTVSLSMSLTHCDSVSFSLTHFFSHSLALLPLFLPIFRVNIFYFADSTVPSQYVLTQKQKVNTRNVENTRNKPRSVFVNEQLRKRIRTHCTFRKIKKKQSVHCFLCFVCLVPLVSQIIFSCVTW